MITDLSTCLLITLSKYSWFKQWEEGRVKHRGEDYEDLKTVIAKKMLEQCIRLYPNLEGKVWGILIFFLYFSTLYSELLLDHYLQSSEFVSESKHSELKNELHQPKYSSENTKCTCMCLYYTCNGTFLREEQLESLPVSL